MATMLRDVSRSGKNVINVDALKSEIRRALIDQKANACPIAMRMAWHAAGTYDAASRTGGCNGATMRFKPESADPANAGLSIIRDLLLPVKEAHPEVSHADLYAVAGCAAIEFLGGPKIPFRFGRTDDADARRCPANGRLPDAAQGAEHLRAVFGRMGFDDRDIVALSGAHTLGRCHRVRSGFDGPWTTKPLQFDNEYYVNLVQRTWRPRKWDGPDQFEDAETAQLMMLPTDVALLRDPAMRQHVERYARDQKAWFMDFSRAYARLLALGCPPQCDPFRAEAAPSPGDVASAEFREHAMHGSVLHARHVAPQADMHQLEATSGRSALHKAAFWGHVDMVQYLTAECRLNPNGQDNYGDTPLHDAAKFGHAAVCKLLVAGGAKATVRNASGLTPLDVATKHGKDEVVAVLRAAGRL